MEGNPLDTRWVIDKHLRRANVSDNVQLKAPPTNKINKGAGGGKQEK